MQIDPSRQPTLDLGDLLIVVPARVSSRRFAGKALAHLLGEAVIAHVVRRALAARVGPVVVVTDSEAIVTAVGGLCPVELDQRAARTGSDRVARYVASMPTPPRWIVNLQGDEPCIAPDAIARVATRLRESSNHRRLVSAAIPMHSRLGLEDADVVKTRFTLDGHADFSREPLGLPTAWHVHVGIYGFSRPSLAAFHQLPTSPREASERLEQLRAVEDGWKMDMVELVSWRDRPWPSVNRPADLAHAAHYLRTHVEGGTAVLPPSAQPQEHA